MILAAAILASSCIAVVGERITAGDLARAIPSFASLAPAEPLGYAPAPGARRTFFRAELARLAARHGIAAQPGGAAVCFERPTAFLHRSAVLAALRAALPDSNASMELLDFSRYPVPLGELEFPRNALPVPPPARAIEPLLWRGRLRYGEHRSVPVWARVRITTNGPRVVAAEDLPAGRPIQPSQVRLETAEYCPLGQPPVHSIEHAAGRIPRRLIRKGAAIPASAIEEASAVERGQTVQVEVSSGAASLHLQARAESAGHAGDFVLLRNPESGRRFPARVSSQGKVIVDAKQALAGSASAGSARRR